MQDETGLALYRKAGELGMPVGVMCFKGFGLHVGEIEALLKSSPKTKVRYTCSLYTVRQCILYTRLYCTPVNTVHQNILYTSGLYQYILYTSIYCTPV